MDSIDQKLRIATCKTITDFEKDWPLLKIGTVYYHSFSEFKEEFGPTDKKILKHLCAYYSAENPVELKKINDEKAKKALIAFLTKRKDAIRASQEFKSNAFTGKQPHTFVERLEEDIKELKGEVAGVTKEETTNTEEPDTRQTVQRDVLLAQFFKGIAMIAFSKENPIKVSTEYDELIEDLDKLPLDETLNNINEIKTLLSENSDMKEKASQNSLIKYMKGETSTTSIEKKMKNSAIKDNKNKMDIIKLITLFKTGKLLNGLKTNTAEFTKYFDGIIEKLPHMVEDILLTYRSFTRFYRTRYTSIMAQFNSLITTFGLENYPIELMIRLVFIMYNMGRFINRDKLSERYNVFKQYEGLLRFTLSSTKDADLEKEYKAIFNLLNVYEDQFSMFHDGSFDPSNKDDIVYQVIHAHGRNRKEFLQPILQLVSGKKININKDTLTRKIQQLENDTSDPKQKASIVNLERLINEFFENKDNTLYIIYQLSPENLLHPSAKNSKIKQLNTLQCLMANITEKLETGYLDDDLTIPNMIEKDITIPRSIEYKGQQRQKIGEIREQRNKEILYNLVSGNTFADFGITISRPLELTQSITNITATLLNAQYLNDKLKAINKKLGPV